MNTYPILKVPESIVEISKKSTDSTEVERRKKHKPLEPKPPIEIKEPSYIYSFVIIAIAAFLIFFGYRGLLLLCMAVIAFLLALLELADYNKKKSVYYALKLRYLDAVQVYQKALKEWESNTRAEYIEAGRLEQIRTLRRNMQSLRPMKPSPGSSVRKGRSEDAFYKIYLIRYFPGKILRDYKIEKYSNYPYTPDFIYYDSDFDFYIDIEIDEPYTIKGKRYIPTHCCDDINEIERDNFFMKKNWIVLRFAEEQVIRHPVSCCKFIALVRKRIIKEPIPDDLQQIEDLICVSTWNTKMSKKMAKSKYRGRY